MNSKPLVSIIVNNYNYDRFLAEAVDSALNQTYPHTEVVVVDDGSTDSSHQIIASYSDLIVPIIKPNGGQASAFNHGVAASSGEIICFLDADDTFSPDKVTRVIELISQIDREPPYALFHNLGFIDRDSKSLESNKPQSCELADLNYHRAINQSSQAINKVCSAMEVYQHAQKYRYVPFLGSATSSLILSRSLAEIIFPLPCEAVKTSADDFVVKAAALVGEIYSSELVLGGYRIHGDNYWYGNKRYQPKEFLVNLDCYLNSILEKTQRNSVLAYFNSLYAKNYLKVNFGNNRYQKELLILAFKVVTWHTDVRTIKFFIKTISEVLYSAVFWHRIFNQKQMQ